MIHDLSVFFFLILNLLGGNIFVNISWFFNFKFECFFNLKVSNNTDKPNNNFFLFLFLRVNTINF